MFHHCKLMMHILQPAQMLPDSVAICCEQNNLIMAHEEFGYALLYEKRTISHTTWLMSPAFVFRRAPPKRVVYAFGAYNYVFTVCVSCIFQKGNTPLHVAALLGQTEMVKLLLKHGADVNLQSDCNGVSAMTTHFVGSLNSI